MVAEVVLFKILTNHIEKRSSPELAKFLLFEIDHINAQLLITTVTPALELASVELAGYDPTWFGTSGIPK